MKRIRIAGSAVALLAGLLPDSTAIAQLALPDVGQILPSAGLPADIGETVGAATDAIDERRRALRALLRRHRAQLDTDRAGEIVIRGEVLAFAPSASALEAARATGFATRRQRELAALDAAVYVLEAPPGMSTRRALRRLRELDPYGLYDFNHLYWASGPAEDGVAPLSAAPAAGSGAAQPRAALRLGLIDAGVQPGHAAFAGARLSLRGCDGASAASLHGTAVASMLLAGAALNGGRGRAVELLAADVYCNAPTGGAVDAVVDALAWLAGERVPVINLSLVGPDNALLRRVVALVQARGHLIVAAVGNDGPAAAPLFPAAYEGVVGVTGVDRRHRVLLEACRGTLVDFAAPGADIEAANPAGGYVAVRGTSFAAPIVAGLLAAAVDGSQPGGPSAAVEALARAAQDLGARGVDAVYGHGLVGEGVLVAQDAVQRSP